MSPIIWIVLIFAIIQSLQTFDEIFLLTGGGPEAATTLIIQHIYQTGFGTQTPNFGLATAASFLLALLLAISGFVFIQLKRKFANG